jgi:hypothetical protein
MKKSSALGFTPGELAAYNKKILLPNKPQSVMQCYSDIFNNE